MTEADEDTPEPGSKFPNPTWRGSSVSSSALPTMFATAVRCSKASRRALTPKRGNKDYYKG
jgi:hypothetical protein